jgi:DNA-binding response OmpR family regulator
MNRSVPNAGGCDKRCHILLVDDDESLLQGLKLSLSHEGYGVSAVTRGEAALEFISKKHADLVVLDVMMPGMDGIEVLRRIRTNPATQRLAVMMLTAKDSDEAKITGFGFCADDYLSKSCSLDELRCRVQALLRRVVEKTEDARDVVRIPVLSGIGGQALVNTNDVYFIDGVRNYSYVHTYDDRFLSRLGLSAAERVVPSGFMRVHRSHIVNLDLVRGGRWATKSQYRLIMGDLADTELAVSRILVVETQTRLGLR